MPWPDPRIAYDAAIFDEQAVDAFAERLKAKMAAGRAKGRYGWADPEDCDPALLREMLREHVAKGDPRDVALLAMFFDYHGWSTAQPLPKAA